MHKASNSRHHLIPQHGEVLKGTNHPDNIKMLKEATHRAFHQVFANREPHAQIQYLLHFNRTALQAHVIKEIGAIIGDEYGYVYRSGLYVPKSTQ